MIYFGLNRIAWTNVDITSTGSAYILSSKHPLRKVIDSDIQDLRKGLFSVSDAWSVSGQFNRVKNSKIWVYGHAGHVNTSDASYENFARCMDVIETAPCLQKCPSNRCDVLLQPFFSDNTALESIWSEMGEISLLTEFRAAKLANPALDQGIFASQGAIDASGFEYNENTWTKRLVGSLERHLPNHNIKYTAEFGPNFINYQSTLSLLGSSPRVVMCYPFRGCNDCNIDGAPVHVHVHEDEEPPMSPPQSSGDEANVEIGKQADRLSPCPPKIGELTAGIHISIVQKCCRMFFKNKPVKDQLNGKGIYINKQAAPCTVRLQMPVVHIDTEYPAPLPKAQLSISQPVVTSLTPQRLCAALKQLVGSTSC